MGDRASRKPALNRRMVRLLRSVSSYAESEAGELNESGAEGKFKSEIYEACDWIDRLCAWYDRNHPSTEGTP